MTLRRAVVVAILFSALPLRAADVFTIDKAHSSAEFRIKHMMSVVAGRFAEFNGVLNIDRAKPASSSVEFTIQAASINTGVTDRDKHLRSAEFFDVERYPTIAFKSVTIAPGKTPDTFNVTGDLTMHGVTKRILLPVEFLGFAKEPQGGERAGFRVETTLSRKEYGITWNRALDPGGFLLGDDVRVEILIQAVKK